MSSLYFRKLEVRRMPGVESGGLVLDDLCPGVNVVHGPNASGKTSTARALEALLWPRSTAAARAWLSAEYGVGGESWRVDLERGEAEHQRNGAPAEPPRLPPLEDRDRYFLALHELLESDNADFARSIALESAGGYDLTAAGEALSPLDRISPQRLRNEAAALEQAGTALKEAVGRQAAIRAAEASLDALHVRRARAEEAQARVRALGDAIEHADARDALRDARIALDGFPAGMSRMTGDERTALARLAREIATAREEITAAEARKAEALAAVDAAALPERGVENDLIVGLRADLAALRDAEREVARLRQIRAGLERKLEEEGRRVAGALDGERLRVLDHVDMGELGDFARTAAEVHARQAKLEAERDILHLGEEPGDASQLERGVHQLLCWLREPSPGERTLRLGRVAAGLLVVAGLLLMLAHPLAMLAAVAGAVLLVLLRNDGAGADARLVHQREYERLQLEQPARWTAEAVRSLLDGLTRSHADALAAARQRVRYEEVLRRLTLHEARVAEVAEQRAALAARLGVAPTLDEGHLWWLADRVSRWQAASTELESERAALEQASAQLARLDDALRARLAPFTLEELPTTGALEGAIRDLEERFRSVKAARLELARADAEILRAGRVRDARVEERSAIFRTLGLEEEDETTVADWSARFPAFKDARTEHQRCATVLEQCAERLQAHRGGGEYRETRREDLEGALAAAAEAAAELDELKKEIVTIDLRVREARASHDVEEALARLDRCTATLREARENDVRGLVAHTLLEHVAAATREAHLPAVFRRSRELFTRLTHGRYELRLASDGEPGFRAYDNRERRGRALAELSSGTRVQLLLAVRVAFVEAQEQGLRLPLVLDEVLGNSDDERADAIMETALQLAAEGRQIFYFTAQYDEVGKWRRALERHPAVECREIDLLERRTAARAIRIPGDTSLLEARPRVPAPAGSDHLGYGRALGVPGIHLHAGAEALHLWYLLDDPESLHALVERGTDTLGTLRPFLEADGNLFVSPELVESLEPRARAAESFLRESAVGAGKPVDREELEASSAITKTFMTRVLDLARSRHGDPRLLIDALRSGAIPGFRQKSLDTLEEHLEENGYLDGREPLEPEEIRRRVIASVSPDLDAGRITVPEVDALLARLRLGVEGARPRDLVPLPE